MRNPTLRQSVNPCLPQLAKACTEQQRPSADINTLISFFKRKTSTTASTSEPGWSPIRRADSGCRNREELDDYIHTTTRTGVERGDKKPHDASDKRGSRTSSAEERHLPHRDKLPLQWQYSIVHTREAGALIRTFIHNNDYCSHKIEKQAGERNKQTSGLLKVPSPYWKLGWLSKRPVGLHPKAYKACTHPPSRLQERAWGQQHRHCLTDGGTYLSAARSWSGTSPCAAEGG